MGKSSTHFPIVGLLSDDTQLLLAKSTYKKSIQIIPCPEFWWVNLLLFYKLALSMEEKYQSETKESSFLNIDNVCYDYNVIKS